MKLRVRERGDEVHVDVDGVAGRQQHVLLALTECQRRASGTMHSTAGDVSIRAGANMLRIRLKGRDGLRFEAAMIYQCLREALVERGTTPGTGAPAP
jgi:hypothetical protein